MCAVLPLFAQQEDSLKQRKNIIKFNLTTSVLYEHAFLFEYERLLKKNRSFTVQAGYETLPFDKMDSIEINTNLKKRGYMVTLDYRFYLEKENKYPAPHGIYIAPFASYNHFYNLRTLNIETSSGSAEVVTLDSKIDILSIGGCLGYQFVLGKNRRWVIDCALVGPSVTNYRAKMQLTGNVPREELDGALVEILEKLVNHFPLLNSLVENDVAEFNGKSDVWTVGFRYSIHLGFRL